MSTDAATTTTKVVTAADKKISIPPEGYVCKNCSKPGHWIQRCPDKKNKNKNKNKNTKKNSNHHKPVPGVDPSKSDIEKAKRLQKLKPPMCFCRIASRLKKVKRSFATNKIGSDDNNANSNNYNNNRGGGGDDNDNYNRDYKRVENSNSTNNSTPSGRTWIEPDYDQSRAIGNYFFFCSKKKEDTTKCRFARPVEDHDEITPKSERICTFFIKKGGCSKGSSCKFLHEKPATTGGGDDEKKRKRTTDDADNDVEKKKKDNDDDDANESDSDSSSSDDDDDDDEQDICKVATKTTSKNDDKDINEQITASIMSNNKGTTATSDSSSSDSDSSDSDSE